MKHKTTLFIYLVLANSFLFAGEVSTVNKASHTTLGQTYSNFDGTSTTEFYNDIPYSELNGINNPDYFENHNNQNSEHYISDGNDSNNTESITMSRDGEIVTTFFYTGNLQTFTVPSDVSSITIQAWGAQGGGEPAGQCLAGDEGGGDDPAGLAGGGA